jgi:hypothetical protein
MTAMTTRQRRRTSAHAAMRLHRAPKRMFCEPEHALPSSVTGASESAICSDLIPAIKGYCSRSVMVTVESTPGRQRPLANCVGACTAWGPRGSSQSASILEIPGRCHGHGVRRPPRWRTGPWEEGSGRVHHGGAPRCAGSGIAGDPVWDIPAAPARRAGGHPRYARICTCARSGFSARMTPCM